MNFIRLATPTTDDKRLPKVLQNTSGFVYYVSITGITGSAEAEAGDVAPEVTRIKAKTDLPIIVGLASTPREIRAIASVADGAVVAPPSSARSPQASRSPRCFPSSNRSPTARIGPDRQCLLSPSRF